jgi:hypothetical protein
MAQAAHGGDMLQIRSVPWLYWLFGLGIGAFALVSLFGFGAAFTHSLACQRGSARALDCTIERSLLGFSVQSHPLPGLSGARLDSQRGRRSRRDYAVVLLHRGGETHLTPMGSGDSARKQAIVDQVNRFVASPDERALKVSHFDAFAALLMAVFLGASLLISPLGLPVVSWSFNAASDTLTVRRWRLLGSGSERHSLPAVQRAFVEETRSRKGARLTRVYLRLEGDKRLYLSRYAASGRADDDTDTAARINAFLDSRPGYGFPPPPAAATGATIALAPPLAGLNFGQQLWGLVTFHGPTYRRIAEDPSLSGLAAGMVVISAVLIGLIGGLSSDSIAVNGLIVPAGPVHAAAQLLISLVAALLAWVLASALCARVASDVFGGNTDTGEMLRVFGFLSIFSLLWLVPAGALLLAALLVVGIVIAIREAAEFSAGRAVATALIGTTMTLVVAEMTRLGLTLALLGALGPRVGVPVG